MEEKEKQTVDTSPVDVDVGTAADVEEVMKKYDRESNTRVYEGWPKLVVKIIMALFSVYCIYATLFVKGLLEIRLTRFWADPDHRLCDRPGRRPHERHLHHSKPGPRGLLRYGLGCVPPVTAIVAI